MEEARIVVRAEGKRLRKLGNVVGTGVGRKRASGQDLTTLAVTCLVQKKLPKGQLRKEDLVPEQIDGIPTDVIEVGKIVALASRTDRHRPVPGGVSIGHYKITAGTLGVAFRGPDTEPLILSNNHILANNNNAVIGDPILQPGPHDGGRLVEDKIAELKKFIPVKFSDSGGGDGGGGCPIAKTASFVLNFLAWATGRKSRLEIGIREETNLVDAAIAQAVSYDGIDQSILEVGYVFDSVEADIGMAIKKSGRTTGLTMGTIQQIDVTVQVDYGGPIATFTDQLLAGAISQGGDSGSLVVNADNHPVGLLFAGSDQVTVINRIQNVESALGVKL